MACESKKKFSSSRIFSKSMYDLAIPEDEFESLPFRESDMDLCKTASTWVNYNKNLYPVNFRAPDETRVSVFSPSGDDIYVNGNYVTISPEEKINVIACQGTKSDTERDFWQMVLYNQVSVILMLTGLSENSKIKCSRYWPFPENSKSWTGSKPENDITVRSIFVEHPRPTVEIALLRVSQGGRDTDVFHIYYKAWPDFGVPDSEEIRYVISLFLSFWTDFSDPAVCHCSAGVGRTGTVLAILRHLKTKESIVDIVRHLRHQRHGMVQTREQYQFIKSFCEAKAVAMGASKVGAALGETKAVDALGEAK
jgi:tyrosine-protein phosphatase non-receptor type 13